MKEVPIAPRLLPSGGEVVLMEAMSVTGRWWPVGREKDAVAGILSFDGENVARLSLIGSFEELWATPQMESTYPIIQGVAEAKKWTLLDCQQVNLSLQIPGFTSQEFIVPTYMSGYHFDTDSSLLFEQVWVSYDHLSAWAQLSGFTFRSAGPAAENGEPRFAVEYRKRTFENVKVGNLQIGFDAQFTHRSSPANQHTLAENICLTVRSSSPMPLTEFLEGPLYLLRNFITLGVGEPLTMTLLNAQVAADGDEIRKPWVKVYFEQSGRRSTKENLLPRNMLFALPVIHERWSDHLQRWFARAADLRPVLDLYFSTLYASSIYAESRFLSLAQALETYHRRVLGGKHLSPARFSGLLEDLKRVLTRHSLDSDTRDALAGKLGYVNELSLRRRVMELLAKLGTVATPFVGEARDFANRFVTTRNYLTHYTSAGVEPSDGLGLHYLSEQTKVLLELCLLRELEFSDNEISTLIEGNRNLGHLRRVLSERAGRSAASL